MNEGGFTTSSKKSTLEQDGWDLSSDHTKISLLTHRLLASEQGYSSLPGTFRYNEAFTKKEHPQIAFSVDELEPACDAFAARKFGAMFEALGGGAPLVRSHADKASWSTAMTQLVALRETETVGQIIDHLHAQRRPRLPEAVEKRERELQAFDKTAGEEMPAVLEELEKLRAVPSVEIKAPRKYLDGHSPFETKHGVKGAEFENVLVVIGRGWNQYNFGEMLELAGAQAVPMAKEIAYERNRNLFYVACSRPKLRLALLFTQQLVDDAVANAASAILDAATIERLARAVWKAQQLNDTHQPTKSFAAARPAISALLSSSVVSTKAGLSASNSTVTSMKARTRAGWAGRLP